MAGAIRLCVDSDLDLVALVARAIRALCEDLLPAEALASVELAVVEAMNNVIEHGYHGRKGGEMEVSLTLAPGEIEVEIVDHAAPMPGDVTRADGPTPFDFDLSDVANLPEGGMGLALIRMSMDEVDYISRPGENRLRMVKRAVG
jgi:serine/threonine-protein kinase RsbW